LLTIRCKTFFKDKLEKVHGPKEDTLLQMDFFRQKIPLNKLMNLFCEGATTTHYYFRLLRSN
jgi:hypothetical protein